jgi:hypothetical protein
MSTLQELENINYDSYSDKPEELVTIAKQFLNLKKFEKGIEILEKAIRFAVANNDNDETKLECAKFYYHYADALIRKCMESDEILAMPNEENVNESINEEKEEECEDEKLDLKVNSLNGNDKNNLDNVIIGKSNGNNSSNPYHKSNIEVIIQQQKKNPNIDNSGDEEEDNDPDQGKNENEVDESNMHEIKEESDENVAFENLFFAENIYKNYLEPYNKEDPGKLKTENPTIIRNYFDLSNVYQKFGELEMCKSDFKSAIDYFTKALEIRTKHDNKFSRAIAELYFNMATAFDFDSKKCLLSFYKTKIIMEYHLKEELNNLKQNSIGDKIIIREDDLESEEIKMFNLFTNRNVIDKIAINENLMKNEEIEELYGIITELNMKIEDVIVDINAYEKYLREKNGQLQTQNQFTTDYDTSKLIDVTNSGIVKKRTRNEDKKDEIEKEEGGKRPKIEKSHENEIKK